jgi:hypothetical protein
MVRHIQDPRLVPVQVRPVKRLRAKLVRHADVLIIGHDIKKYELSRIEAETGQVPLRKSALIRHDRIENVQPMPVQALRRRPYPLRRLPERNLVRPPELADPHVSRPVQPRLVGLLVNVENNERLDAPEHVPEHKSIGGKIVEPAHELTRQDRIHAQLGELRGEPALADKHRRRWDDKIKHEKHANHADENGGRNDFPDSRFPFFHVPAS